jgi:hypothetical protein
MENSASGHIGCLCQRNGHVSATLFVSRSFVEVSFGGSVRNILHGGVWRVQGNSKTRRNYLWAYIVVEPMCCFIRVLNLVYLRKGRKQIECLKN